MNPKYEKYVSQDLPGPVVYDQLIVFTLTMDRLEYTKRMLSSLDRCLSGSYLHIIVDQGSTDGTVDFLEDIYTLGGGEEGGRFRVILLSQNIGISAASNLVLDLIDQGYPNAKYVWKIDNDCELISPDMDKALMEIEDQFDGRVVLSPYVQGLRENAGGAPRYATVEREDPPCTLGLSYHLGGICEFASKKSYDGFRFDEGDTLSGSQDSSYSSWVGSHGMMLAYCETLFCEHMDSTEGQHKKYPEYFKKRDEFDSKVSFTG
jgi:glycosyltransferase involved in cell wall biosynthesis